MKRTDDKKDSECDSEQRTKEKRDNEKKSTKDDDSKDKHKKKRESSEKERKDSAPNARLSRASRSGMSGNSNAPVTPKKRDKEKDKEKDKDKDKNNLMHLETLFQNPEAVEDPACRFPQNEIEYIKLERMKTEEPSTDNLYGKKIQQPRDFAIVTRLYENFPLNTRPLEEDRESTMYGDINVDNDRVGEKDEVIPDFIAIPDIDSDETNANQRLSNRTSLLRNYIKEDFWGNGSEGDLCGRINTDIPVSQFLGASNSLVRMLVSVENLSFKFQEIEKSLMYEEPFFCSLTLYDISKCIPICETFHFDFNSNTAKERLGVFHESEDFRTKGSKCIFTFPSSYLKSGELWLVLRVDKVFLGDPEDHRELYIKAGDSSASAHDKQKYQKRLLSLPQLGGSKQFFCASAIEVTPTSSFVPMGTVIGTFSRSILNKDVQNIFELINEFVSGPPKKTLPGSVTLRFGPIPSDLSTVRCYASSLSQRKEWGDNLHGPNHSQALSQEKGKDKEKDKDKDFEKGKAKVRSSGTIISNEIVWGSQGNSSLSDALKTTLTSDSEKKHKGKDKSKSKLSENSLKEIEIEPQKPLSSLDIIREMVPFFNGDLGVSRNELVHSLFIYPDSIVLPKEKKKLNIEVSLYLRDRDSADLSKHSLSSFVSSSCSPITSISAKSSITFHSNSPSFCDEFRCFLPLKIKSKHHLLFVVKNVEVLVDKKEGPSNTSQSTTSLTNTKLEWYGFLPLANSEGIGLELLSRAMKRVVLNVGPPPEGYTSEENEGKTVIGRDSYLDVRTYVASTITPTHSPIAAFLMETKEEKMREVLTALCPPLSDKHKPNNHIQQYLQFFPQIFEKLCMIISRMPSVSGQALKSLLVLCQKITWALDGGTNSSTLTRNYFIQQYLQYSLYSGWGDEIDNFFMTLLEVYHNTMIQSSDYSLLLEYLWIILEMASKSIAITVVKDKLDMNDRLPWLVGDHWHTFTGLLTDRFAPTLSNLCVKVLCEGNGVGVREANVALALFVRVLCSVCHRGMGVHIAASHIHVLSEVSEKGKRKDMLAFFKLEFLFIISDHEHFYTLNIPLARTVDSGSKASEFIISQYPLMGIIVQECLSAGKYDNVPLRICALYILVNIVAKCEYDKRYENTPNLERTAFMLLPFLLKMVESSHWENALGLKDNMNTSELSSEQQEERCLFYLVFLFILKYADKALLTQWFCSLSTKRIHSFTTHLSAAIKTFTFNTSMHNPPQIYKNARVRMEALLKSTLAEGILVCPRCEARPNIELASTSSPESSGVPSFAPSSGSSTRSFFGKTPKSVNISALPSSSKLSTNISMEYIPDNIENFILSNEKNLQQRTSCLKVASTESFLIILDTLERLSKTLRETSSDSVELFADIFSVYSAFLNAHSVSLRFYRCLVPSLRALLVRNRAKLFASFTAITKTNSRGNILTLSQQLPHSHSHGHSQTLSHEQLRTVVAHTMRMLPSSLKTARALTTALLYTVLKQTFRETTDLTMLTLLATHSLFTLLMDPKGQTKLTQSGNSNTAKSPRPSSGVQAGNAAAALNALSDYAAYDLADPHGLMELSNILSHSHTLSNDTFNSFLNEVDKNKLIQSEKNVQTLSLFERQTALLREWYDLGVQCVRRLRREYPFSVHRACVLSLVSAVETHKKYLDSAHALGALIQGDAKTKATSVLSALSQNAGRLSQSVSTLSNELNTLQTTETELTKADKALHDLLWESFGTLMGHTKGLLGYILSMSSEVNAQKILDDLVRLRRDLENAFKDAHSRLASLENTFNTYERTAFPRKCLSGGPLNVTLYRSWHNRILNVLTQLCTTLSTEIETQERESTIAKLATESSKQLTTLLNNAKKDVSAIDNKNAEAYANTTVNTLNQFLKSGAAVAGSLSECCTQQKLFELPLLRTWNDVQHALKQTLEILTDVTELYKNENDHAKSIQTYEESEKVETEICTSVHNVHMMLLETAHLSFVSVAHINVQEHPVHEARAKDALERSLNCASSFKDVIAKLSRFEKNYGRKPFTLQSTSELVLLTGIVEKCVNEYSHAVKDESIRLNLHNELKSTVTELSDNLSKKIKTNLSADPKSLSPTLTVQLLRDLMTLKTICERCQVAKLYSLQEEVSVIIVKLESQIKRLSTLISNALHGESKNLNTDAETEVNSTSSEIALNTRFLTEVESFAALMRKTYTDVAAYFKLESSEKYCENVADILQTISLSFVNTPNLHIFFIERLAKLFENSPDSNRVEAAICNLYIAKIIYEFARNDFPCAVPLDAALEKIAPFIIKYQVPQTVLVNEPEQLSYDSFVRSTENAYNLFKAAKMYEFSALLAPLLNNVEKQRLNFAALERSYQRLSQLYSFIISFDNARMFAYYYRVAFYGKKFAELDETEWIYKASANTRLLDFTEKIQSLFKHVPDIVILDSTKNSTDEKDKNFVQITSVLPYFEAHELTERVSSFDMANVVSRFYLESPFVKDSNKARTDDITKQCKRKVILNVEKTFPCTVLRQKIISKETIELEPLETAVDLLRRRTNEMNVATARVLNSKDSETSALKRLVQGSIALQVNGGCSEICQKFLGDPKVRSSFSAERIAELSKSIKNFLLSCKEGLAILRKRQPEDESFNNNLVNNLEQLTTLVESHGIKLD